MEVDIVDLEFQEVVVYGRGRGFVLLVVLRVIVQGIGADVTRFEAGGASLVLSTLR